MAERLTTISGLVLDNALFQVAIHAMQGSFMATMVIPGFAKLVMTPRI
jgi:hypothetical protein